MLIEDALKEDLDSEDDDKARDGFPIGKVIDLTVVSSYYDDTDAEKIAIESYKLVSYESRTLKI